MQLVRDTWLIFRRSLWLTVRQPAWIVFGMMQPFLYLFLFGPLLEGAAQAAGTGTNAFNWFVPGLLVQIALFGTAFVGFGLIAEMRNGVDRAHAGHAHEPDRDAPRPLAARRRDPDGPGDPVDRPRDPARPTIDPPGSVVVLGLLGLSGSCRARCRTRWR